MDGWTLIERLRTEKVAPGVPVVVFSADRTLRSAGERPHVDGTLSKPFDLEELQDVVERLVRPRPAA
jgi:CheY-like chemotaxis protein